MRNRRVDNVRLKQRGPHEVIDTNIFCYRQKQHESHAVGSLQYPALIVIVCGMMSGYISSLVLRERKIVTQFFEPITLQYRHCESGIRFVHEIT